MTAESIESRKKIQKIPVAPKPIPLDREPARKPLETKTVWVAVGLMAIVLIALGALAAQKLWNPPSIAPPPVASDDNAFGLVKAKVLYSNDCRICEKTSLLLLAFDNAGYQYKADLVDVDSVEGKKMVSEFNASVVPTLLLDANSLGALPPNISSELVSAYPSVGKYLVISELSFMNQTNRHYANIMYLQSPNPSCTTSSSTARVDAFLDFVDCPVCASSFPRIQNMQSDLGGELQFNLHYALFHGVPSERAAVAHACAEQQGKGSDFASCAFKIDSNYSFLDGSSIDYCATQSQVPNLTAFNQCVDQNQTISIAGLNGSDRQLEKAHAIRKIPSFIVDCKVLLAADGFVVRANGQKYFTQLKEEVCRQRPDLRTCQQLYAGIAP